MAFVSPLSLSQLKAELDDTSRNLARMRTILSNPANQTTTSTVFVSVVTVEFTIIEIARAVIPLKTFIQSNLSNDGAANNTDMVIGYNAVATERSNIARVTGTTATTRELADVIPPVHTVDIASAAQAASNIVRLSVLGRVSAGTGTFATITGGVIVVRGP